jgi:rod shape-determining protein MreD
MSFAQGQPLRLWGWIVLPVLLVVLATVTFGAPARVFGLRLPEPVWAMVLAFAWPVIRPTVIAPFVLLLLGLFLDLFWGAALGQWCLALLAAYGAALLCRPLLIGQGALVLGLWWLGFTVVLFGAMQLLTMFDLRAAAAFGPVALQWLATAVLYPFAYWLIETYEDAGARLR